MTTQKPELMPDEISLFRCECEGDIKWSEDSSDALATYVNEDLYTAACAERDALRALCEGMAGYAGKKALRAANRFLHAPQPTGIDSVDEKRAEEYQEAIRLVDAVLSSPSDSDVYAEMANVLRVIASGGEGHFQWSMTKAEKMAAETLTAYEKHKEGE